MLSGVVDHVRLDPAAQISQSDLPGITVIIDTMGGHADHFHIQLKDPDGPDSNNC